MEYSFDIEEAKKYGLKEAIMLKNFKFWISKNRVNGKFQYDGKTWTYNSVKALNLLFPFWTEKQIRTVLQSLIDQNVIVCGNYNKSQYDRTKWYALVNEEELLKSFPKGVAHFQNENLILPNGKNDFTKWENENDQMGKPIPYNNTYNNKDNKQDNISLYSENEKKEDIFINPVIDTFIKQAKEILNQNVYLLKEHREKILELNRAIDNFEEITPEVLRKLKALKFDFGGRTTKPNIDWLLKDTNFIKLLNDELPQVAPATENQNEPEEIWSINDYMNKRGF